MKEKRKEKQDPLPSAEKLSAFNSGLVRATTVVGEVKQGMIKDRTLDEINLLNRFSAEIIEKIGEQAGKLDS